MKPTQREAWAKVQNLLPQSRLRILKIVMETPGLTAREIELRLGGKGRHAESRITELEQQGLVRPCGVKPNPVTHFMAQTWEWTGRDNPNPLPKRKTLRDELEELRTRLAQVEARVSA